MSNGVLASSQYEYPIENQELRQGSQTGIMKAGSISNKNATAQAANNLPKRTPHSELTSY
jgi:hypothetical protein